MATTSAGLTTFVNANGSSSGQFRAYLQFGDAKTTNGASTTAEQMAQVPRPSSGQIIDRTPAVVSARLTSHDRNQPNSSRSGLGTLELLELTSNPVNEGILGPNKDGRVRNPVPSKLKGKTDNKQGNFGVMHMGTSPGKKTESHGRDAAAERDAAARKTSEATASRAKAAQSDKYIPPKKRGLEAALNDGQLPTNRGSQSAASRDDHRQRARPLAPDETKFEQARLLTLLRSIQPLTVADQICKAVAYFGGIPGAPPPEDGIFPESANTGETGALFIGWIAEIFPDTSSRSPEAPKDHSQSKKKGKVSRGKIILGGDISVANEPPNSRNGYGYGPAVSALAWGPPPSLALVNPQGPAAPIPLSEGRAAANPIEQSQQESEQIPSTPVRQQVEDGGNSATSTSKRRRGRPKGSRNKGKGDGQQGSENDTSTNNHIDGQDHAQAIPQATEAQAVTKIVPPNQAPPSIFPAVTRQSTLAKTNQALQYPDHSWQGNTPQNIISQAPVNPIGDGLSPEERAVLEAFRHQGPETMNVIPSPVVNTKSAPEAGHKRKRAPPKPKLTAPPTPSYPVKSTSIPNSAMVSHDKTSIAGTKDAMQWTSVESSTTSAPPPKRPRPRKPKPSSSNDPPSRNQTASAVSSVTPPIAPSTIPDPATSSSQQSIPVSRPPAEGLEAHYERFASLQQQQQQQQQQNGRSNTPTLSQQHVRQHSKPSSIAPQQSTPQMQQQQMQQQKSQQSSQQQSVQRDDLKMNQVPSARPSSTSFYNQRNQPSTATATTAYNQQYPSHQPPQIYSGHQASPQMSTSSYRTSSTHTMAQASPQFSQAENTYKTSSTHTAIPQPSPSFAQNDSNFRANNSHNLTQPSPSFSQADNTYRAPSTHSMSQPTPSYSTSRSHNQNQQSHQGHYGSFPDSSYIDLPTLESLGHSTNSSSTGVSLNASGYGQSLGVGLTASSRPSANSNTLYGSSGLGNAFDTSANDLLRGISRTANNNNAAYGAAASGLNNAYETGANEHDMRESLLRGLGGRR